MRGCCSRPRRHRMRVKRSWVSSPREDPFIAKSTTTAEKDESISPGRRFGPRVPQAGWSQSHVPPQRRLYTAGGRSVRSAGVTCVSSPPHRPADTRDGLALSYLLQSVFVNEGGENGNVKALESRSHLHWRAQTSPEALQSPPQGPVPAKCWFHSK